MKHRYARWISALAAVAATTSVGCSVDEDPLNPGATGTTGTTAGMTTTGVVATTAGATTAGSTGSTAGTSGGTTGMTTSTTALTSGGMTMGATTGTTAGTTTTGTTAGTTGSTAGTTAGTTGDAGMTTAGPEDGGTTGGMTSGGGSCLPVASSDDMGDVGPHTPTHVERVGPSGDSWVYYPEDLGEHGPAPVFMWGPGAGTGPSNYLDHLNRLASHGFVVISQSSSLGQEVESLDWLLAQNEDSGSQFYQKLDPSRVGMGGHSMGSLGTMRSAGDPRLNLYVLVCGGCMSGRGGCGAADIHGPTVILGGSNDIGTPNYEGDYEEITAPVSFLTKDGTGHIDCARANLEPWVSFMRWQWCGEDERAPEFMSGGEYCTSPWECESKNW